MKKGVYWKETKHSGKKVCLFFNKYRRNGERGGGTTTEASPMTEGDQRGLLRWGTPT